MGDAGLDDEVGLHRPDQLLHRNDVLRVLDDRASQPLEVVGVLVGVGPRDPVERCLDESLVGALGVDFGAAILFELFV